MQHHVPVHGFLLAAGMVCGKLPLQLRRHPVHPLVADNEVLSAVFKLLVLRLERFGIVDELVQLGEAVVAGIKVRVNTREHHAHLGKRHIAVLVGVVLYDLADFATISSKETNAAASSSS